ncbi:MAG: hypothetical protein WCS79_09665 [Paludibacter sp.]
MMAKIIKFLFTVVSAAYFMFAGTGYNVVNYCCQSCAQEGIEAVATNSCNAIHHHLHSTNHAHQKNDIACNNINHHPTGCHLLRLTIDTPSVQTTREATVDTINYCKLFYTSLNFLNEIPAISCINAIQPPDGYFLSSGREIITFHAVLLI